jgi:glutathione S-transferase
MMITISAFKWVPEFAQGQVRDLRARWALEEAGLQKRLSGLSKSLGGKPFLDGDRFTAGDLMMTTVLRILKHTDIVSSDRRLAAYIERCSSRPAFRRALDAQIGDFKKAA